MLNWPSMFDAESGQYSQPRHTQISAKRSIVEALQNSEACHGVSCPPQNTYLYATTCNVLAKLPVTPALQSS